jgi:O-acetyl-ADP-ribose deacetylase (regulator of RNase III)
MDRDRALRAEWTVGPGRLALTIGDLTRVRADGIVNAANSSLLGGGGVDGAIHRAAGPELLAACRVIVRERGRLPAGQAVLTPGFSLPARHVIHTVGPVWQGGGSDERAVLASAYASSIALAKRHGLRTLAFPAISCGAYGYPQDQAAKVAVETIAAGLRAGDVDAVDVVLFSAGSFRVWRTAAEELLGPPNPVST